LITDGNFFPAAPDASRPGDAAHRHMPSAQLRRWGGTVGVSYQPLDNRGELSGFRRLTQEHVGTRPERVALGFGLASPRHHHDAWSRKRKAFKLRAKNVQQLQAAHVAVLQTDYDHRRTFA